MSQEHKDALAEGRVQGAAVRRYLESLEVAARRGRRPDVDRLRRRLTEIDETLDSLDPIGRLQALQERIDITKALTDLPNGEDAAEALDGFIKHARPYARRKGISYQAFRQVGVPAAVLNQAGIHRASGQP